MNKKMFTVKSECDVLDLDVTVFEPENEIKGIFQISHGMAEHKERYYKFMEYLTQNGYVTVINDHRGHGKSVKNNDDLGYFYDNSAEYIVEDLHQITKLMKEQYPNKPLVLFGHSMGSMVVRKYIKKYDDEIDKLIVCGSPSKNKYAKVGLNVAKLVEKLKGEKYRSKFIQKLAFGSYSSKKEKSENSWICDNEDTVNKYDKDELCGFIFTANGFQNLFSLMIDIYDKNGWKLNNKNLPILFIAGSNDPVIMNKEKWLESQDFLKTLGYNNIQNKLYDGMRHEILNEKESNLVYKDILDFIK